MDRPERVPKRQVGKIPEIGRLMDFLVKTHIIAICIVKQGRHLERTIKGRIENPLLVITTTFDFYGGQFFFPCFFGFFVKHHFSSPTSVTSTTSTAPM